VAKKRDPGLIRGIAKVSRGPRQRKKFRKRVRGRNVNHSWAECDLPTPESKKKKKTNTGAGPKGNPRSDRQSRKVVWGDG